jgi:hypothetical protein
MDEKGKEPGVVELHSEPDEYVEAETGFCGRWAYA